MSFSRTRGPVSRVWLGRLPNTALGWVELASGLAGALVLLVAIVYVFRPVLTLSNTLGTDDLDAMAASRLLVRKTLLRFHQFPFWNPYGCGGHPAWGGAETDPVVVSPWLPAYLLLSLPRALRVELVGSTVLGALGVWLLTSRFTRSRALCVIASVLFALSSRATLQLAVGHAWHATYAYLPWVLFFYDRAANVEPGLGATPKRDIVLASVFLALEVYAGGTYPLAHTVMAVAAYALLLSAFTGSLVPAVLMIACALLGAAFAAPRLLPLLDVTRRFPLLVDSSETMSPAGFMAMLTSRDQDTSSMPVQVSQWAWHEWGMYIGWPCTFAILVGLMAARGVRERALRIVGGMFVLLAFGAFCEYAPWTLLHTLPVFASQQFPSRWMMPALLLVACVAASAGERLFVWTGRWRCLAEMAAMVAIAFLVRDICRVARTPLDHAFVRGTPTLADSVGEFKTVKQVPPAPDSDAGGRATSSLAAVLANSDSIECLTFAAYSKELVKDKLRWPGLGARAVGDIEYRGEAYIGENRGTAKIIKFTPNEMVVRVEGARPGDHVVLNQNWDPGWIANGERASSWHDAVANVLPLGSATVNFRYWPRGLSAGLFVLLLAIAVLVAPAATNAVARFRLRAHRQDRILR